MGFDPIGWVGDIASGVGDVVTSFLDATGLNVVTDAAGGFIKWFASTATGKLVLNVLADYVSAGLMTEAIAMGWSIPMMSASVLAAALPGLATGEPLPKAFLAGWLWRCEMFGLLVAAVVTGTGPAGFAVYAISTAKQDIESDAATAIAKGADPNLAMATAALNRELGTIINTLSALYGFPQSADEWSTAVKNASSTKIARSTGFREDLIDLALALVTGGEPQWTSAYDILTGAKLSGDDVLNAIANGQDLANGYILPPGFDASQVPELLDVGAT